MTIFDATTTLTNTGSVPVSFVARSCAMPLMSEICDK